eukprot:1159165-Pelagomonas_calceolata.AAC.5
MTMARMATKKTNNTGPACACACTCSSTIGLVRGSGYAHINVDAMKTISLSQEALLGMKAA